MQVAAQFLLTLGGILLLGLATDVLGRHTFLPRISLLLLFGMIIGPGMLNLIPDFITSQFEIIATMALLMVGFLIGGKLTGHLLKAIGRQIMWISICAALVTAIIVMVGLVVAGVPLELAIVFGCLAAATDPAATFDVIKENKHQGRFEDLLLSIVAVDDAWTLMLFSIGIALAAMVTGVSGEVSLTLIIFKDIGGAVLLGILIGLPAAYATGRIRPGQPMFIEALGIVFVCGGLALWFEISFLIASMVAGIVIVNLAKHHDYPFHAIEDVEWLFMIIFFVLAGASLELSTILDVGLIGAVYVVLRVLGKILGAGIGGICSDAGRKTRTWMGIALLPQAGVAMGMALVAANQMPEHRQMLLSIAISSTIFFEIVGPVFTRLALRRVQE